MVDELEARDRDGGLIILIMLIMLAKCIQDQILLSDNETNEIYNSIKRTRVLQLPWFIS